MVEQVKAAKIESGETYTEQTFDHMDYARTNLSDCTFVDCSFVGTRLRAADLSYAHFIRCQFNDTSSEHPADFSQAILREAQFEHCNVTVVDFIRVRGYGLRFDHCQMQGADLSKSDFRMPVGDSELAELTLTHCNLAYANLAENYLPGTTMSECRLVECCLDYCDLTGSTVTDCEMHNITARGITLRNADLRGSTFNNLNVREIDLTGVRLNYSQIPGLLEPLGIVLEADP